MNKETGDSQYRQVPTWDRDGTCGNGRDEKHQGTLVNLANIHSGKLTWKPKNVIFLSKPIINGRFSIAVLVYQKANKMTQHEPGKLTQQWKIYQSK